jgi:hypothetical protein
LPSPTNSPSPPRRPGRRARNSDLDCLSTGMVCTSLPDGLESLNKISIQTVKVTSIPSNWKLKPVVCRTNAEQYFSLCHSTRWASFWASKTSYSLRTANEALQHAKKDKEWEEEWSTYWGSYWRDYYSGQKMTDKMTYSGSGMDLYKASLYSAPPCPTFDAAQHCDTRAISWCSGHGNCIPFVGKTYGHCECKQECKDRKETNVRCQNFVGPHCQYNERATLPTQ